VARPLVILKVGGSLYDLPDLRSRLQPWLSQAKTTDIVLVPGGGATADVIRDFDRVHRLGEEYAHWMALKALELNAQILARLLPSAWVIDHPKEATLSGVAILNAYRFMSDETAARREGRLPHYWAVTSDAIAARAAVVAEADQLILLKSVTIPPDMDWEEAGERGFVDEWFARTIRPALPRLKVSAVNLREWRP
jgi:5-(aminomethyl)-3-furanmethanol phosphate kinase